MNDGMSRNICKMIIQRDEAGNYFPRSLQGLSEQLLDTNEALELLRVRKDAKLLEIESLKAKLDVCNNQLLENLRENSVAVGELIKEHSDTNWIKKYAAGQIFEEKKLYIPDFKLELSIPASSIVIPVILIGSKPTSSPFLYILYKPEIPSCCLKASIVFQQSIALI